MAETTINTKDAGYETMLANLASIRAAMIPLVRKYNQLSVANQNLWLQRDPLLAALIDLVETFPR